MKPAHIRIQELRNEVANLTELHREAKEEYTEFDDLAVSYRKKADDAEKRKNDLQSEIEYRLSEMTELEGAIHPELATA